jgi:hypothetical protein
MIVLLTVVMMIGMHGKLVMMMMMMMMNRIVFAFGPSVLADPLRTNMMMHTACLFWYFLETSLEL